MDLREATKEFVDPKRIFLTNFHFATLIHPLVAHCVDGGRGLWVLGSRFGIPQGV